MNIHKPYIIVLGNEKGGTGKSTVSMHILTSLLYQGFKIGSVDVDARQGTLSRYIENRQNRINKGLNLPISDHVPIFKSTKDTVEMAEQEEREKFEEVLEHFKTYDYILIDTPGSDSYLSRLAHSYADTLITPLNDSFIDLDMLVRVDNDSLDILKPSTYAEMVWEQRKQRAIRKQKPIDWIVVRNRLSHLHSKNKEEMKKVLSALSKRIGFRLTEGFGERVIFKELFLSGLTLVDTKLDNTNLTLSHVAAKQELNNLISTLNIPEQRKEIRA